VGFSIGPAADLGLQLFDEEFADRFGFDILDPTKIIPEELVPAVRDFLTDAYAHCKFIGHAGAAAPLLAATGVAELMDDGFIELGNGRGDAAAFLGRCGALRYWQRESAT
jgi:hypothetical protein